jgi:hypothetical protein
MLLTESNIDAILVKAMKNCTSGKMIMANQVLIDQIHAAEIAPKETSLTMNAQMTSRKLSSSTT